MFLTHLFNTEYSNIVNNWNIYPKYIHCGCTLTLCMFLLGLNAIETYLYIFSLRQMFTVCLYENNVLCLSSYLFQSVCRNELKNKSLSSKYFTLPTSVVVNTIKCSSVSHVWWVEFPPKPVQYVLQYVFYLAFKVFKMSPFLKLYFLPSHSMNINVW